MTMERAVREVREIYRNAKANPQIRKPVSYSLYQAWMWASAIEQERKGDEVEE